jgi:ubiquinone/menaquinone biosynthesis C-methylase UbiE
VSIDPRAAAGFRDPDVYERGRPGYPDAAVDHAFAALGLAPGARVLDLGAGTGKLARSLLERAAEVVAVEPLDAMRQRLESLLPRADARPGTAEAIPLPDASVDAAFAGEAFHWFATPEAVAEIGRVVRPGGGVALLWNVAEWEESEELMVAIGRLMAELPDFDTNYRRQRAGEWRAVFGDGAPFDALEKAVFEWVLDYDRPRLLAQVASFSWVGALPDARRAGVLERVQALLERHPAPVRVRTQTEVWTTRRRPEP